MELLIVPIVLLVLWFLFSGKTTRRDVSRANSASGNTEIGRKRRILDANMTWLQERWNMADATHAAGTPVHLPEWYFDAATDRQRDRLLRDGLSVSGIPNKGQASDIIGLFEPPDDEEAVDKLKFFGVLPKGEQLNQTRVRHELAMLESDPSKEEAWRNRPATPWQRECYRFLGEKPSTGVTFAQAEAKFDEAFRALPQEKQDEWSQFEDVVEEFEDSEARKDMDIKKPTLADIRIAMAEMRAAGKDPTDAFEVAEYLIESKPSLARN